MPHANDGSISYETIIERYNSDLANTLGNLVNRTDHSQSGAVMAFRILDNLGLDADEIAKSIYTAIQTVDAENIKMNGAGTSSTT